MKGLFVDTAGWVACTDTAEPAHKQAAAARDRWLEEGGLLVTTDYVADETLTLLRARFGLDVAEAWWRQVDGSPRLRWEFVSLARADKARGMFFQIPRQGLLIHGLHGLCGHARAEAAGSVDHRSPFCASWLHHPAQVINDPAQSSMETTRDARRQAQRKFNASAWTRTSSASGLGRPRRGFSPPSRSSSSTRTARPRSRAPSCPACRRRSSATSGRTTSASACRAW